MRLFGKLALGVLLALSACSSGSDSGGGGTSVTPTPTPTPTATATPTPTPAGFTRGTQTTVVPTQTVGTSGATITVPASAGALAGVRITIPAGALSANRTVSVASDSGTLAVQDGTAGSAMHLNFDGGEALFDQPVSITIPYTGSAIPVPYYVDAAGALHLAQISGIDRTNHTVTFDTFHASLFTWINALANINDAYATAFTPQDDGFQIVNTGSSYNRGGECFGMTSFAQWYFKNVKGAEGKFFPRFMDTVGTNNPARNGQQIIATRAFTAIAQQWNSYYSAIVGAQLRLSDSEQYTVIRSALKNTQRPVIIYLAQSNGSAAHSVLAYGYDRGDLSTYDVNFPGTVHHIVYDAVLGSWKPYTSAANANAAGTTFDRIAYNGDGSITTEPYRNILADAKLSFNNSANATVAVTSHTSGQSLTSRIVTLTGKVTSSQVLVRKIRVMVGSTPYTANVASDGTFSAVITITAGTNYLSFVTYGRDSANNEIVAPNNTVNNFTLIGSFPESVILTTLTWDTNDTDIDTYVIDPTGDYSAYYHKTTADGGFLDYDVTTGYGPEHWLLTTANTVRWGQPYKVRLHYYSDHGHGPSNYTVGIQVYDGVRAQTSYFRGNLGVSVPSNDQPGGTGADWANIATITPVQPTAALPAGQSIVQRGVNGQLNIRVAVPLAPQRVKR